MDPWLRLVPSLNKRCPVNLEHPTEGFFSSGNTLNATQKFSILLVLASLQKLLPFSFSCLCPFLMLVGISIPYLWVVFRMRDFSTDMITSLFRIVYGTRQAKLDSSMIPWILTNSEKFILWDSFRYFKWIHDSDWSRHWNRRCHPTMDLLISFWLRFVTMYMLSLVTPVAASFW